MNLLKQYTFQPYFARILGITILMINSTAWAGDFVSPTRPDDPPVPPEVVEPITNEYVFSGYVCEMNIGNSLQSTISVEVYSEPFCQGSLSGFVRLCSYSVGLSCPHEDNPAKNGYLYSEEIKPALIQNLQRSMIEGQKIKVYRLSNTFDFPHYTGPLDYGNKVVFSAQP